MKRRRLLLALLPCLVGPTLAAQESEYKIVVNAANPVAQLKREQVTALFMTRSAKWAHGPVGAPVDQSMTSAVRQVFSREILGQPAEGVQNYWRKRMVETREFPPPVKPSDAEVVAAVAKEPGGIGYVSAAAELPAGVKAVKVVDPIR